jgi:plasmid stabilization system protein ParE
MRVVFSAQAKESLRDIALYIARDHPDRARSFVRELAGKARQIGKMPRAYAIVPRFQHHNILRRVVGNYLIFYRIKSDGVAIVDMVHGARDYDALLFPDEEVPRYRLKKWGLGRAVRCNPGRRSSGQILDRPRPRRGLRCASPTLPPAPRPLGVTLPPGARALRILDRAFAVGAGLGHVSGFW